MIDKELQEKLRHLKIDVLSFLNTLSVSEAVALDLEDISKSTKTPEANLKGIIGTLRRIKFKDKSIIQPAGKDSRGRHRWKINESVVKKSELSIFLGNEIFGKT